MLQQDQETLYQLADKYSFKDIIVTLSSYALDQAAKYVDLELGDTAKKWSNYYFKLLEMSSSFNDM